MSLSITIFKKAIHTLCPDVPVQISMCDWVHTINGNSLRGGLSLGRQAKWPANFNSNILEEYEMFEQTSSRW